MGLVVVVNKVGLLGEFLFGFFRRFGFVFDYRINVVVVGCELGVMFVVEFFGLLFGMWLYIMVEDL